MDFKARFFFFMFSKIFRVMVECSLAFVLMKNILHIDSFDSFYSTKNIDI